MANLRDILLPSASPERVESILIGIKEIEENIEAGKNVEQLINQFNQLTGREYDEYYFRDYWRFENSEDFARAAAQPLPRKISDIAREELIEIIERIRNADRNSEFYLELLERNLPHPRISDLIYWPRKEGLADNPTSEEILNKAMNYRPIQL